MKDSTGVRQKLFSCLVTSFVRIFWTRLQSRPCVGVWGRGWFRKVDVDEWAKCLCWVISRSHLAFGLASLNQNMPVIGYWLTKTIFNVTRWKGKDLSSKILQHWNCVIITDQMITFQTESNLRAMCALNWIVCRLIHLPLARVARELRYSWDIPVIHLRYTCENWHRLRDLRTPACNLRITWDTLARHTCEHLRTK